MESLQIKMMFETIAPSYDFQNSVLSLGRDIYWRRELAEDICTGKGGVVLDAATGTGELCFEILKRRPGVHTIGVDFSPRMLSVAKKKLDSKALANSVSLALGDGRLLLIKSNSIDAVTMAFGIRNIRERHQVLSEFRRVLKDGGQLLIMEFDFPSHQFLGQLYRFYFDRILPPLGNWISRTDYAYTYLAQSVHGFPDEKRFCAEIEDAGFHITAVKELTFGVAKIYESMKR